MICDMLPDVSMKCKKSKQWRIQGGGQGGQDPP